MIVIEKYEVVKFVDGQFELEVNVSPEEETIWMSANQMAVLFVKDEKTIRKHINNIFNVGELIYCDNTQKVRVVGVKQFVTLYSLNVIISVGYRVKSNMGVKFRIWANQVLKEYLLKGYVINENRVTVSNENYIELKNEVTSINNRLLKIEDKVLDKEYKVNKIFFNGELNDSTVKEILTVRFEGTRKVSRKIKLYNLDMIISIRYRINSKNG